MTQEILRPMNTSQVLDRTFYLYRKNFVLFAGIAVLPPGLVLIGELIMLMGMRPFMGFPGTPPSDPTAAITTAVFAGIGYFVLFVLGYIGYAFASGASVCAVSRVHLGKSTSISEAYRLLRPHLGSILGIIILLFTGAMVVMTALFIVGVIVFVAAGIRLGQGGGSPAAVGIAFLSAFLLFMAAFVLLLFLYTKFALAVPACVIENLNVTDSLKRSWNLTVGTFWRLVLVFILSFAMSLVLSLVLSVPYFIGLVVFATRKDPSVLTPLIALQYVAGFVARTLAFPISTIAAALIYYDQRVRKEAFDLQLMMDAIGQPVAPSPVTTSTTAGLG